MEFIAGRSFNKQPKQLLQENDKLYEGMELHTKNIRFSPEHRDHQVIKQTHKIMMGKENIGMEKMSWWGNIEGRLYLQAIIFLHQLALLKDVWETKFLGFMKPKNLKRMIKLWPLQICLEKLSIYIHFKIEAEEFVA